MNALSWLSAPCRRQWTGVCLHYEFTHICGVEGQHPHHLCSCGTGTGTGPEAMCFCPWNNGYLRDDGRMGHHVNCPSLEQKHAFDDDCDGIRGHRDSVMAS